MTAGLPPPPINSPDGSFYWIQWYTQLTNILSGTGYPWASINFAGSDIASIVTRNHNELSNIQGGTATGTSPGAGDAYHMTGRGYVSAAGAGTGLPTGWSVALTSTGVYTITHNLGLAAPNIGAVATSNTAGVTVSYIDLSSTTQAVVHLSGNGAFTFIITS
jgi:hypothetical protein